MIDVFNGKEAKKMRAGRIELPTPSVGRMCSPTELRPQHKRKNIPLKLVVQDPFKTTLKMKIHQRQINGPDSKPRLQRLL